MSTSRYHPHPHLKAIENALAAGLDAKIISFTNFDENNCNCYSYVVDLMFRLMDRNKTKGIPVARALMKYFDEWLMSAEITEKLTSQLKEKALKSILKLKDPLLVKLVFDVFKIEESVGHFRNVIRRFLSLKNIIEAFHYVERLKLHKSFSISEILLPLIFQDKRDLVYQYLTSCPEVLPDTLKILDDVCLDRRSITNLASSLSIDIGYSKLDPKWLRKVITSMLKHFGLEPDKNSNCHFAQCRGAMKHLLYTRYVEETVGGSSFEEFAVDLVKDIPKLQCDLLIDMVAANDGEAALRVAKELNLPPNKWPQALCFFVYSGQGSELSHTDDKCWDDDYDDDKNTLDLELDFSQIPMVTTKDQFLDFVKDVSQHYSIVGFDSEWKPSFFGRTKQSLLQFGVSDKVYLIDLVCLESSLKQQDWDFLFEKIFYNPELLKLGYGVEYDLKLLYQDHLGATRPCNFPAVLDLRIFYDQLLLRYPQISTILEEHCAKVGCTTNADSLKGLSKLSLNVLGKPLAKGEQLTNWEKRPLSVSQITYAALDASCLVRIYRQLSYVLQEIGVDINDEVKTVLGGAMRSKTNKKKMIDCPISDCPPISIEKFRVVVDNMLAGLGKHLRLLGADAVIVPSEQDHIMAAKVALEEERIILSNGLPLNKLKGYVPEDMWFCVPLNLTAKEQTDVVLKHFNIQVTSENVFTRCSMCNTSDFLKIPSKDLKALWETLNPSCLTMEQLPLKTMPYGSGFVKIINNCAVMHTNVPIKLHDRRSPLSVHIFNEINEFLVCSGCGKVYWEGSHFDRAKVSLTSQMTPSKESAKNIYEKLQGQSNCTGLDEIDLFSRTGARDSLRNNQETERVVCERENEEVVPDPTVSRIRHRMTLEFELPDDSFSEEDLD